MASSLAGSASARPLTALELAAHPGVGQEHRGRHVRDGDPLPRGLVAQQLLELLGLLVGADQGVVERGTTPGDPGAVPAAHPAADVLELEEEQAARRGDQQVHLTGMATGRDEGEVRPRLVGVAVREQTTDLREPGPLVPEVGQRNLMPARRPLVHSPAPLQIPQPVVDDYPTSRARPASTACCCPTRREFDIRNS